MTSEFILTILFLYKKLKKPILYTYMNKLPLYWLKAITEESIKKSNLFIKENLSVLSQKEHKYKTAVYLDILCILIILIYGIGIQTKIISPLSPLSPFGTYEQSHAAMLIKDNSHETFSFAPGWGFNKLNKIDFSRLNTLAYFDVPVNADGTLNKNTDGYITFKSDEFYSVTQKAHAHGTKVVVTISQSNNKVIKSLLDDPKAQQVLIDEIVADVILTEIDGVTIDFEFAGNTSSSYRSKFTNFIDNLTQTMHREVKNSQVSVAVSGSFIQDSIYDLPSLAEKTDRIFLIAYDFAVPEHKNEKTIAPEYGYKENEYWETVLDSIDDILMKVPSHKVVLETAWYGNGDNYPLYMSNDRDTFIVKNSDLTYLETQTIERLVSEVPQDAQPAARRNLPYIASALKKEGILSQNILAYALATIEHETAGTFEPIEEYGGRKSARRLGYEGGTNYFGRGFIQLTHLRNYKIVGERIGLGEELVKNPDLALDPKISAAILASFFKDNGIARLAENGNFIAARRPVNPDSNGWWIATLASKYLGELYS